MPLLEIKHLTLEFGSGANSARPVDDVSLTVEPGQTVCLVGESGSGKSLTALSIARLAPVPPARYVSGEIWLGGKDVLRVGNRELRQLRGGMVSYVFQEPSASLNPVFRIGSQIQEALRLHRTAAATEAEVVRLLRLVGIPAAESRFRDYPHQMSGGMQQRVMIAMAIASQPRLLVADEPTTALDVTIQAQIIDLLRELRQHLRMSILLITHNLGIVGDIADRVFVMYAGQIVESGPAAELLRHPLHPYTQALLLAVPGLAHNTRRLTAIPGSVPWAGSLPAGCRFHPRCRKAQSDCSRHGPQLREVAPGRTVRCHYWHTESVPAPRVPHPAV
jgi:oligopeptide/dipeptide ABC transporter ATP-binding protein